MKTRIVKDVKSVKKVNNKKYEVLSTDNTFFIINEQIIIDFKIRPGLDITDIYEKILYENDYYNYYEKALKYLLRGFKSSNHVKNYLFKNKCPNEFIYRIILKLEENKILSDKEYILAYTKSLINKGYGRLYIRSKLKTMNFTTEDIMFSINNISEEEYINNLKKVAIKKMDTFKKMKNFSEYKLKTYLYSRGYEGEDINKILKKLT